ncbi:MAG: hypothetical protein JXR88_18805 [Clostridia bacterium]|nr:hypothetical protein [Clostridia bacterium]
MFKKKRKGLILILVLVMMLSNMVFATDNDDYTLTGTIEANGTIYEGDVILYKMTLTTKSNISGIKVYVSGDFSLVSGSSFDVGDLLTATGNYTIPVSYNGSGNKLNVLVDNGAGKSIVQNITVGNVSPTSTSTPEPVDKDRLYPEFNLLLKDSVPRFSAGSTTAFEFDLENITTNYGKDVQVIVKHGDNFPFDDSVNTIATSKVEFKSKEKKTLSMNVTTPKNVAAGFYTIPLEIKFKNIYGLEKTVEKSIQVEIISREKTPSFVVDSVQQGTAEYVPGTSDQLQINIKNIGTIEAKNVSMTLQGLNINGITLNGDTATKYFSSVSGGAKDFGYYKINISDALKTTKSELSVLLTYSDAFGKVYEETLPVYVNIQSVGESLYDFDVKVNSKPSTIQPDDQFTIKFDLINSGKATENLKISFKSEGNFISKSDSVVMIKSIDAGATKSLNFELIAPTGMTSNNYPSYIVVENSNGETREFYVGLYVDGDTASSSKPKIIIDAYDFGKENILAGETFDLTITFFNTSNTMGIRNAKISISTEEGAFVPVNTASSFYIEEIGVKEKVSHTITMKAKSDLNVKTYNVTANIEYEDSNGNSYDKNNNPYTATESMAIPVMQELRLEVEELNIQPFVPVYQPTEIFVEFFNMGKSPLNNMMVTTEGDFDIQDGKYFVGTFAAGSNDYYSCNIIPYNPGLNSGKVIFEFEDAVGEKHIVEKTFEFEAMEMEENYEEFPGGGDFGEYDDFGMEEPKNESPMKKIIIFGVIGLVAIILIVVVVKVIKKKKELKLND